MSSKLTPEQLQVVQHPLGTHARVLAVAGSGKSTTMAHRIKHLVLDHGVSPATIQVLMFNSLARKQFILQLDKIDLPENRQPVVHTFHSFSFNLINQMVKIGVLPSTTQFWLADKTELIWLTVKRAITNLEREKVILPESINPEDALQAIGLWKGALIPPHRAGSYNSPLLPLVYAEFEQLRLSESAMTFDDFIPAAIEILEHNPLVFQRFCGELQHLIVDEYQDVNYGQQHLLEIIGGNQADVMVVGDDDQTIYEWRGARPNYIIQDFAIAFKYKTVKDYRLSRSFRFGPVIAQCAANVIACNTTRVDKPLVAFQPHKTGYIHVIGGGFDATKEITNQVSALLTGDCVPASEVIVLARLFAQLDNLEMEFLSRQIPYRVDGQQPFYKRQEINTLLDYIRLARDYAKPISDESSRWLLNVANKPSRMLSRTTLNKLLQTGKYRNWSLKALVESAIQDRSLGLGSWQVETVIKLHEFMSGLSQKLQEPTTKAGDTLDWMVQSLDYLAYFQDYYGKGEHSDEKKFAVLSFIRYVNQLHIHPLSLLDHLNKLDTTQGADEKDQIVFTTIFRTKGLEYDYVVIPQCDENLMPYLKAEQTDIYDIKGIVRESSLSSSLESERRLFYVALTRARKGVMIGSSTKPSRFLEEILLKDTTTVMEAVQWLASGHPIAKQDLLEALKVSNANPSLLNNLLSGYLPDMGQSKLAAEIIKEWSVPTQQTVSLPF